ncbi:MAG TPA: hypothetical protein VKR53_16495 [Puia sp.]|nr:hypothetical protein [Puia sp.]
MLNQISWNQFITFLFVVLGLYYGVIIPKYYKKEIVDFLRRGKNVINKEP